MQSKLFGNRSVLDIGVSSRISNVNESSGIASNKGFGVLGVSNVVANPVALKVKTGKELSSQPTMLIRATLSLTRFSCQWKITMLLLIIRLSTSWQSVFPVPRADWFDINAVVG